MLQQQQLSVTLRVKDDHSWRTLPAMTAPATTSKAASLASPPASANPPITAPSGLTQQFEQLVVGKGLSRTTNAGLIPDDQDKGDASDAGRKNAAPVMLSHKEVRMEVYTGRVFQRKELTDESLWNISLRFMERRLMSSLPPIAYMISGPRYATTLGENMLPKCDVAPRPHWLRDWKTDFGGFTATFISMPNRQGFITGGQTSRDFNNHTVRGYLLYLSLSTQ